MYSRVIRKMETKGRVKVNVGILKDAIECLKRWEECSHPFLTPDITRAREKLEKLLQRMKIIGYDLEW